MREIKYLLKFGQKQHMEAFASGTLYCSNAQAFWGIEDELKIKGQGDRLEGSSRFFGNMFVYDCDDLRLVAQMPNCSGLVRYEPAKQIPVFCLFAVYEEDCITGLNGESVIKFSDSVKKSIREHFPKANAVAIVDDPNSFIVDIENSIDCEIKHGLVQYFYIDNGLSTDDGKQALDMQYMKYLTQDEPPVIENGKKVSRFLEKHVYRSLLCKDVFFKDEQEYRIILVNERISTGTCYPVNFTKEIRVIDIDDFFDRMK